MNRTVSFVMGLAALAATAARSGETPIDETGSSREVAEALLPMKLAPDVHVLCASHRFQSATVGWITLEDELILIDCAHPDYLPKILAKIQSTTGKPLTRVILTHAREPQLQAAQELLKRGVPVCAERQTAVLLKQLLPTDGRAARAIREVTDAAELGDGDVRLQLHPFGHASRPGNLAVFVPHRNILFAGEICSNGPKNDLPRGSTKRWIEAIGQLQRLSPIVL